MASPRSRREAGDYYRDRRRRKVCNFCVDKAESIDYKEVNRLRRYLSERAKIEPRRKTGTCAEHQRQLSVALKRAPKQAALIEALQAHSPLGRGELEALGIPRGIVKALLDKGLIEICEQALTPAQMPTTLLREQPLHLSDEQHRAFREIAPSGFQVCLPVAALH
jgi:small subunit ribosomal protein S18